jgi:hypothetical protein
MTSAITTNVYGLRSASRTIHINSQFALLSRGHPIVTTDLLSYRRFNLDSWERLFGYGPYRPATLEDGYQLRDPLP